MTKLTQQQVQGALKTGFKMLTSTEISTPNAWNRDLIALEELIVAMLSGQIKLSSADEDLPILSDGNGADPLVPKSTA